MMLPSTRHCFTVRRQRRRRRWQTQERIRYLRIEFDTRLCPHATLHIAGVGPRIGIRYEPQILPQCHLKTPLTLHIAVKRARDKRRSDDRIDWSTNNYPRHQKRTCKYNHNYKQQKTTNAAGLPYNKCSILLGM